MIDILDKLATAADPEARWKAATDAADAIGLKSLLVGNARAASQELAWANTNMTEDWMDEYIHENYVEVDTLLSGLAQNPTTCRLDGGTLKKCDARSHKDWVFNNSLRQAGYGTLIARRYCDPDEFGAVVTLGFEQNLGQGMPVTDVDLTLFSAIVATNVTAPLPDRTNRALTGTSLRLSPRQRDVLCLLASGHQTARIAEKLGVTEATVTFHMARAREALGAQTREHALALALKYQLIAP